MPLDQKRTRELVDSEPNANNLQKKRKNSGQVFVQDSIFIKRKQACDRCRLKKIKCDDRTPDCTPCMKAGIPCRTTERLKRRGFAKGYTEQLEQEVARLEKLLKDNGINDDIVTIAPRDENKIPKVNHDNFNEKSNFEETSNQIPYMNKTFHLYDNYYKPSECSDQYMGNCTWSLLTRQNSNTDSKKNWDANEEQWSKVLLMNDIINYLNLDPQLFVSEFLLKRFNSNLKVLKRTLINTVQRFFEKSNSLIPLLYPFSDWKQNIIKHINKLGSENYDVKNMDPAILMPFLLMIQLDWGCLNESRLFNVTKTFYSSCEKKIENLQGLLLAAFYFMDNDNTHWATELIHLSFAHILDLGLFITIEKKIPYCKIYNDSKSNPITNLVTFWTFQFLESWWNLIQGLPKTNFIIEEFHPKLAFGRFRYPTFETF